MYLKIVPMVQAHDDPEWQHLIEIGDYRAGSFWLTDDMDRFKLSADPDSCWFPFPVGETQGASFEPRGALFIEATRVHPDIEGHRNLRIWIESGAVYIMNDSGKTIERLLPPWEPRQE